MRFHSEIKILNFFGEDFFGKNIQDLQVYQHEIQSRDDFKMLEIGCYEGRSTHWFASNYCTGRHAAIDVIDQFSTPGQCGSERDHYQLEERFRTYLRCQLDSGKVNLHKGSSAEVLRKFSAPDNSKVYKDRYRFIYIDGGDEARSVLNDAILSWDLLAIDGIMVFTRYNDPTSARQCGGIRPVVDFFLKAYAEWIKVLKVGGLVHVRKIST